MPHVILAFAGKQVLQEFSKKSRAKYVIGNLADTKSRKSRY